jgi:hypothetical protein
MDSQDKVTQAFKNLRKQGFIARQQFSCCGSCAGYAIATDVAAMTEAKRSKVKGAVFFTRQDVAELRRGAEGFYLKFGQVDPTGIGPIGLSTVEVGKAVVAALSTVGLKFEWSGDEHECIWVEV